MKNYENILRKNDLKITHGRIELLDLLYNSKIPMNTEEIYSSVNKKIIPSFTSLYRMLNELSDKNILKKNLYHNGLYYFEFNDDRHRHYIVCAKCGEISAIENCPIADFEKIAEKETGYTVISHIVELRGICPDCQKNKKD
ncbi:MAG: Fur family transcriptional regulator [Peptoniphilus lacydonensis]|nr:Fur family transcriptional regulator [Peptoniphilus lacydonensis]